MSAMIVLMLASMMVEFTPKLNFKFLSNLINQHEYNI